MDQNSLGMCTPSMTAAGGIETSVQSARRFNVRQLEVSYKAKSGKRVLLDFSLDRDLGVMIKKIWVDVEQCHSLGEKVASIVKQIWSDIASSKDDREDAYLGGHSTGMPMLGPLLMNGRTMCREKAIFTHLMLAKLELTSMVVSASTSQGRHSWVELDGNVVLDSMNGKIYAKEDKNTCSKKYTRDRGVFVLFTPISHLPAKLAPEHVKVAQQIMKVGRRERRERKRVVADLIADAGVDVSKITLDNLENL
jgi:hypothetical protein